LRELDVDIRRLPAERRLRDADDRERLAAEPEPVADGEVLARRVALVGGSSGPGSPVQA
jgi:hypothetical protein